MSPHKSSYLFRLERALHKGRLTPSEHKAVLMAWDRVSQLTDDRAA